MDSLVITMYLKLINQMNKKQKLIMLSVMSRNMFRFRFRTIIERNGFLKLLKEIKDIPAQYELKEYGYYLKNPTLTVPNFNSILDNQKQFPFTLDWIISRDLDRSIIIKELDNILKENNIKVYKVKGPGNILLDDKIGYGYCFI